jgi:hypothetical protein
VSPVAPTAGAQKAPLEPGVIPLASGLALRAWIGVASRGEVAEYWRGLVSSKVVFTGAEDGMARSHFIARGAQGLPEAIRISPRAADLAATALALYEHGDVLLVQKRMADGSLSYRAVKYSGPPARKHEPLRAPNGAPDHIVSSGRVTRPGSPVGSPTPEPTWPRVHVATVRHRDGVAFDQFVIVDRAPLAREAAE